MSLPSLNAEQMLPGSPRTAEFLRDPATFLAKNCISSEALCTRPFPNTSYSKIVSRGDIFEFQYGGSSIPTHFLGHGDGNQTNARPPFIDIPKGQALDNMLVVTGSLTGGSFVVTEIGGMYRVFHDSRRNSSIYYDNVVMAVDFLDIAGSECETATATVFMRYISRQWTIFVQLQEMDPLPALRKMPKGESVVFTRSYGSYNRQDRMQAIDQYRERYHDQLLQLANGLGIVVDNTEGEFQPGVISDRNDGIRKWQSVRDAIISENQKSKVAITDALYNLEGIVKRPDTNPTRKLHMQRLCDELQVWLTENRRKYDTILHESRVIDLSWLWMKEKEANGIGAVVCLDLDLKTNIGGDIGARYAEVELDLLRRTSVTFIQGFNSSQYMDQADALLTALEMKNVFLNPHTADRRRGALLGKLEISCEREYISYVKGKTASVVQDFQNAGGSVIAMSQDLFLGRVGDKFGARCYPLVRAMAVAQGTRGIDGLVQKMTSSAADLTSGEAELFKKCLKNLHANYEAAGTSTALGRYRMEDVVDRLLLVEEGASAMYALTTRTHSMMVGVTMRPPAKPTWVFYDPNFVIATFTSPEALIKATERHFSYRGFAVKYGGFGTPNEPTFDVVEIDHGRTAQILLGHGLTPEDLNDSQSLVKCIDSKKATRFALSASEQLARDQEFAVCAMLMESIQWADRWREASAKMLRESGLSDRWMPVLATLSEEDSGRGYRIQFMNRDDLDETRWVHTDDPTTKEFLAYLDGHLGNMAKESQSKNRPSNTKSDVEAPDGLNSAIVVQALIEFFSKPNQPNDSEDSNLSTALTVHGYINVVQMGYTAVGDISKTINLVKTLMRSGEAAEGAISTFGKTLSRMATVTEVASAIGEGVGVILGGISVGLDAYELAHAENSTQKAVFGTQLAFDSTSLAIGIGSIGAGLVGAASAAAVLGGVGVIFSGLAVAFGALAEAFGEVAQDAEAVGVYFSEIDTAYGDGGYRYDEPNKYMVPIAGSVVRQIDLRNGRVDFDSQFIYRTKHGSTGSGRQNYFFWAGDIPTMVKDRAQAINVRAGIGKEDHSLAVANHPFTGLILPATPKSYISYEYSILGGATTRKDRGFDIIRRLENDYRFDYDFYAFPFERIIRNISQEYVDTAITVILDRRPMRLDVPPLPDSYRGKLSYTILGDGGSYVVGLNRGASLTLSVVTGGVRQMQWGLDAGQLGGADVDVRVSAHQIVIGGVTVNVPDYASRVTIVKGGEVFGVDFVSCTSSVVAENAAGLSEGALSLLLDHLEDLAKHGKLHTEFVVVSNYKIRVQTRPVVGGWVDPDAGEDGSGDGWTDPYSEVPLSVEGSFFDDMLEGVTTREVGRAFYEVAENRMIYTNSDNITLTSGAELAGIIDGDAYFYNTQHGSIWRVWVMNGRLLDNYCPFYPTANTSIIRVWKEENVIFAAYRYNLSTGKQGELVYAIQGRRMTLVSVVGDYDLLLRLSGTFQTGPLLPSLSSYNNGVPKPPLYIEDEQVYATDDAAIVSVFGEDSRLPPRRYWLRKKDGAVIKLNLQGTAPADIVFVGPLISDEGGREVFYFYAHAEQKIYRQVALAGVPDIVNVPESFGRLSNMFNTNGELFASTEDGYILRLTSSGVFFFEAVNDQWFVKHGGHNWWVALETTAREGGTVTAAVFGVKNPEGVVVPTWYHDSNLVIASNVLHDKKLQLFGVYERDGGHEAWLCYSESKYSSKLYRQPLVNYHQLDNVFDSAGKLAFPDQIPTAQAILGDSHLRVISAINDGLQITTADGAILVLSTAGAITLVAVNAEWQNDNRNKLDSAMELLAKTWSHSEVVIMQGSADTLASWYHVEGRQLLSARGVTWAENPVWLGMSSEDTAGLVHLQSNGAVYTTTKTGGGMIGTFEFTQRYGKTLVLGHPGSNQITIPMVAGAEFAMVTAKNGGNTYDISQEVWNHYKMITIDNAGTRNEPVRVSLEPTSREIILGRKVDSDLVLLGQSNGNSLTICGAYGTDRDPDGLLIYVDSSSITVGDFQRAQSYLANYLKIDTIPDVTLRFVVYHRDHQTEMP